MKVVRPLTFYQKRASFATLSMEFRIFAGNVWLFFAIDLNRHENRYIYYDVPEIEAEAVSVSAFASDSDRRPWGGSSA